MRRTGSQGHRHAAVLGAGFPSLLSLLLELKLGLAVSRLYKDRWKKPAHNTRSALAELQSMFQARFEEEL